MSSAICTKEKETVGNKVIVLSGYNVIHIHIHKNYEQKEIKQMSIPCSLAMKINK